MHLSSSMVQKYVAEGAFHVSMQTTSQIKVIHSRKQNLQYK